MVMLLLVGGQNALAKCFLHDEIQDVTYALRALHISQNWALGTPFLEETVLGVASYGSCDGPNNWHIISAPSMGEAVPGMTDVYQTNIPGIGVKIIWRPTYLSSVYVRRGMSAWLDIGFNAALMRSRYFSIKFYITGPISGGGVMSFPSPFFSIYTSESPTGLLNERLHTRFSFTGTAAIVMKSCAPVNNGNIAVNLPTLDGYKHPSIGAVVWPTAKFEIALKCNSWNIPVKYRIDGTPPSGMSANTGVIANRANQGDATGFGVQLLRDRDSYNTPVVLGEWVDAGFGDFQYADSSQTYFNGPLIRFFARYYRTSSRSTSGAVWAHATFTMNYQ